MGAPAPPKSPETTTQRRLDSWKEIASYLSRDVTTVQRWEKREGMPVHRHLHDKRGSVYALSSELDAWRLNRKLPLDQAGPQEGGAPAESSVRHVQWSVPRTFRWVGLACLAAIVVIAITYMARRGHSGSRAHPKIRSLAVLPLKNLTGDPAQDYLADGMTEALIGRLANIRDLRVVSSTSVMRFKNPQTSVPDIARTLGVDAIVEGSVMREGNRVRVTAQLIRAAADEHFWSETYDREFRDVLTLQSELAQTIAEKVEVTLTGDEQARLTNTKQVAPEVYESYLKGLFRLENGNSKADVEASISYFDDVIHKDSTFAPAYVGLARSYTALGSVSLGVLPGTTRPKAIEMARRALQLDPNLAEAHALLANVLQEEFQWTEAEAEYKRALDLTPNDANARAGYSLWLLCQGRTDEALASIRRARELDPIAVSGDDVSWVLFQSHRYDEAIRESRSALGLRPNSVSVLTGLGFVLVANNQSEEAIPVLQKALSLSRDSFAAIGVLIRAYAHAGRRRDALRLLAELNKRRSVEYVPAAAFVNAYLGLGDNEQAFTWLEQAYKEKSNMLQFVKTHPYFDPIRSDPRFLALVQRVGLG